MLISTQHQQDRASRGYSCTRCTQGQQVMGKRNSSGSLTACIVSLTAIALLFLPDHASAQVKGDNDTACQMMSAYAKMGVGHDQLLPLVPACAKSRLCTETWQTMVIAGRSDVDLLSCDQAPALESQKTAAARAFAACYKLWRDGQVSPSSLQQDAVELTPLCNQSTSLFIEPCYVLHSLQAAKLANPGLVCNR
jgi:hypothetical protein